MFDIDELKPPGIYGVRDVAVVGTQREAGKLPILDKPEKVGYSRCKEILFIFYLLQLDSFSSFVACKRRKITLRFCFPSESEPSLAERTRGGFVAAFGVGLALAEKQIRIE